MGKSKPRVKFPPKPNKNHGPPLQENVNPAVGKTQTQTSPQNLSTGPPPFRKVAVDEDGRLAWPDSHVHLFPSVMFTEHHPHAPIYVGKLPWADTQHVRASLLRAVKLYAPNSDRDDSTQPLMRLFKDGNLAWELTLAQVADLYERHLKKTWDSCEECKRMNMEEEGRFSRVQLAELKLLELETKGIKSENQKTLFDFDQFNWMGGVVGNKKPPIITLTSNKQNANAATNSQQINGTAVIKDNDVLQNIGTNETQNPTPSAAQDSKTSLFSFSESCDQLQGMFNNQAQGLSDFSEYLRQNASSLKRVTMSIGTFDPHAGTTSYHTQDCKDCYLCASGQMLPESVEATHEKAKMLADMFRKKLDEIGVPDHIQCEIPEFPDTTTVHREHVSTDAADVLKDFSPFTRFILEALPPFLDITVFDMFLPNDFAREVFFRGLAEGVKPTLSSMLGEQGWRDLMEKAPPGVTRRHMHSTWKAFVNPMFDLYGARHKGDTCLLTDCNVCGGTENARADAREVLRRETKRVLSPHMPVKWEGGDRDNVKWSKQEKPEPSQERVIKPLPKRHNTPTVAPPTSANPPTILPCAPPATKPPPPPPSLEIPRKQTPIPKPNHSSNTPNFDFGMSKVRTGANFIPAATKMRQSLSNSHVGPRNYMPPYLSAGIDMFTIAWFLQDVEKGAVDRARADSYSLGRFNKQSMTQILKAELLRREICEAEELFGSGFEYKDI